MSQYHNGGFPDEESSDAPHLPGSLFETARLQRDRRTNDRGAEDRRQSDRAEVAAKAKLGTSLRFALEGQLHNLSAHGCSMCIHTGSFKVGDDVWFRIDTIQPWKGTIRWINGDNVGVQFERPFHRSVFDLLVQSNNPVKVSTGA